MIGLIFNCILLGFILGVLSTVLYCLRRVKQLGLSEAVGLKEGQDEVTKVADKMKNKIKEVQTKVNSVKQRLMDVYNISKKQQELQAALDMPSQNATHSRYKNGLISELRELDEKKQVILNSILKDGFDPTISVLNEDGSKEDMKLSQFVAKMNGADPLKEGELPPATPKIEKDEIDEELEKLPRKSGKFTVYTGKGKPDTNH